MLIGIDFDNTIVCYDRLFYELALEAGLIPTDLPATKRSVCEFLRAAGREDDWTELQGRAYGPEIHRAELFPGILEFLQQARRRGAATVIISHKTPHALRGPKYDLHAAAREFLQRRGFFAGSTGLTESRVFFEPTKRDKLARIGREGCTHFIDDLADVLDDPEFPPDVLKFQFEPSSRQEVNRLRIGRWENAFESLAQHASVRQFPDSAAVSRLLRSAGFSPAGYVLAPRNGGRNNRSYVVTTDDGRRCFLKWYFQHADDWSNRLDREYAIASHCREFGIDSVAAPLARDDDARLGLYEYLDGKPLAPGGIRVEHIEQAVEFINALQVHRSSSKANELGYACEATPYFFDHHEVIERRMERVAQAASAHDQSVPFRRFVQERLLPAWLAVKRRLEKAISEMTDSDRREFFYPYDYILSPSDFGFHNAFELPDGRLRFFDFEYAGWDDVAKLTCDFFCQPAVPVPLEFAPKFIAGISRTVQDAQFIARTELLFPAYRIKWCAIVLNEFTKVGAARREFGTGDVSAERLVMQLDLAGSILDRLEADGERPIFTAATTEPRS